MNSENLIKQLSESKRVDPGGYKKEFGDKTPEEIAAIEKRKSDYNKSIRNLKPAGEQYFPISLNAVKKKFKNIFEREYCTELIINDVNRPILDLISRYFAKDISFNKTPLTANIPNLNKGLLITGKYGCGKTAMMNTFHLLGKELMPNNFIWFVATSTLELVDEFESAGNVSKEHFFKKYNNVRKIYFDDFGTEEHASNYGKKNLMKDILEKRYLNKKKTYLTTNLSLLEIKEKYGPRVFDRLQEQFNILEFPGESFRK